MLKIARVQDIILDASHPGYAGELSIGTILYTFLDDPPPPNLSECNKAKPLNANIKQYPVPNEIVFLVSAPSPNYNEHNNLVDYYLHPHAIYKDPNLNALPNALDASGDFYKGEYFPELEDIRPLQPYEGDLIIEGRFGNSIRFGATTPRNLVRRNYWSSKGNVGDPITIIRNGQKIHDRADDSNFDHTIEHINFDDSCIFLCSNQSINIFIPASTHEESYQTKRNNSENEKHIEPEIDEETPLTTDVQEDIQLNTPDPLNPIDTQVEDELSTYNDSGASHFDISPSENQIISVNDALAIPESYNVPDITTDNFLLESFDIGEVLDISLPVDNTAVNPFNMGGGGGVS